MSEAQPRTRDRPAPAPAREIADVERQLRESTTEGVEVIVGQNGARVYFGTWEPNPAFRGELLAGLCTAIAESEHWGLSRIHDPMEREDSQLVSSAVTVVRAGDDDE